MGPPTAIEAFTDRRIPTMSRNFTYISLAIYFLAALLSFAAPLPSSAAPEPSSNVAAAPADFASLVRTLSGKWQYVSDPDVAADKLGFGTVHGEQVWRTSLGGSVLLEEEHIVTSKGDQYVLALHWWDRSTNSLKGMVCNNSGSGACDIESSYRSKLDWDGKRLTINLVFPQGSKLMLWHEEFSEFTGASFTQTGDIGEVNGPLRRVMAIRAKKVADLN